MMLVLNSFESQPPQLQMNSSQGAGEDDHPNATYFGGLFDYAWMDVPTLAQGTFKFMHYPSLE